MVVARWRFAVLVLALGTGLVACGSDTGDDGDKKMENLGGAGMGANPAVIGTDLDSAILFSPMYSAYDGAHDFKVPAVVNGYTGVEWRTDKPELVDLEKTGTNSVMITTRGAGVAKIIAKAGPLEGSSVLTITQMSPADWELGNERYNNEVPLPMIDRTMINPAMIVIPDDLSCRNCHGGGAMALSVEHTPQQTGGYSDEDLVKIFTMGMKPPTAGWKSGIPMFIYTMLHTWSATPEEQKGIIAYLRALTPASQGEIDFGGITGNRNMAGASGAP